MKWFSWRRIDRVRASSEDFVVATLRPPTSMVPSSMPSRRPTIVRRVDLPAPLGPTSAVMPPAGMSSEMEPMRTDGEYCLTTESMEITGGPSAK